MSNITIATIDQFLENRPQKTESERIASTTEFLEVFCAHTFYLALSQAPSFNEEQSVSGLAAVEYSPYLLSFDANGKKTDEACTLLAFLSEKIPVNDELGFSNLDFIPLVGGQLLGIATQNKFNLALFDTEEGDDGYILLDHENISRFHAVWQMMNVGESLESKGEAFDQARNYQRYPQALHEKIVNYAKTHTDIDCAWFAMSLVAGRLPRVFMVLRTTNFLVHENTLTALAEKELEGDFEFSIYHEAMSYDNYFGEDMKAKLCAFAPIYDKAASDSWLARVKNYLSPPAPIFFEITANDVKAD